MRLLAGMNHVASLTEDMDRLKDFYTRVFDATCVMDEVIPHGPWENARHAFIDLAAGCVLHPWERPGSAWLAPMAIFDRGRVDHIALQAASREAFDDLRERLVDEGASDGTISDFGSLVSIFFRDPDGMEAEVALWKDGVPTP